VDAVAKEIGELGLGGNVASEIDAAAALEVATKLHGTPRVLVNCAGTGAGHPTVSKNGPFPLDAFKSVLDVNLVGSFNVLRLAAECMSREKPIGEERGVIINTASVAAFDGQIGQAAYSASKGGVVGITLPIARDLARFGIRVNTIAPGLFLTPLLMQLSEKARASLGAPVPFPPRLGDRSHLANSRRGSEKTRTQIQAVSERENEHQDSGSAEKQNMFEYIGSGDREERAGYRAYDCSHVSLSIAAAY
jgi:NAD(P)-dependent dehydrogenase (short-subunit alcohol dehydrogenase family)